MLCGYARCSNFSFPSKISRKTLDRDEMTKAKPAHKLERSTLDPTLAKYYNLRVRIPPARSMTGEVIYFSTLVLFTEN